MIKFTRRQTLKRVGGKIALIGSGAYGAGRGLSRLFGGEGGGGGNID